MKQYPSIEGWKKFPLGTKVIAFDKLDGSNIRFEWSKKRGWYKFGTRTQMLDKSHPTFGSSIDLFLNKYGEVVAKRCFDEFGIKERIVAFAEFYGPNSFAGRHFDDDIKDIVLFEVDLYKKGSFHQESLSKCLMTFTFLKLFMMAILIVLLLILLETIITD